MDYQTLKSGLQVSPPMVDAPGEAHRELIKRKVVLAGDASVGKTSLIARFVTGGFDEEYISTLGTSVSEKRLDFPTAILHLMVWDLSGQIEMTMVQRTAFSNAKAALIVSDLSVPGSVDRIPYWVTSLYQVAGEVPIVLLGNKVDLVGEDSPEGNQLRDLAGLLRVPYRLTSARTGLAVEEAFRELGDRILHPVPLPYGLEELSLAWFTTRDPHGIANHLVEIEDRLISTFVAAIGDESLGMELVRKQVQIAGFDFREPTLKDLERLIDQLHTVGQMFTTSEAMERFAALASTLMDSVSGD